MAGRPPKHRVDLGKMRVHPAVKRALDDYSAMMSEEEGQQVSRSDIVEEALARYLGVTDADG